MIKNDKLDALIMLSSHVLADYNCESYLNFDVSDTKVSKSLTRRVTRYINRERRRKEYGKLFSKIQRAAVVVLVICTGCFTMLMSVKAVREAIWEAIVELYEDYFTVSYVQPNNSISESPPLTIESKHEPSMLPVGWKREVTRDKDFLYRIEYTYNDEVQAIYKQFILSELEQLGDNENTEIYKITINGINGLLFKYVDKGLYSLRWNDGQYSYSINTLSAEVSEQMLISIAESVQ